jgi:predicted ATPase/class 3 adenylate cyclase/DNA-binding XRE family transcriptional regulator
MASPSDLPFADLLRQLRKAAGLTQSELAERAGLSVRGLNDLERGARTTPRRDTVLLLADALELTGDDRAAFAAAARRASPAQVPALPSGAEATDQVPVEPTAASLPPEHLVHKSAVTGGASLSPPTGTVTFLFTDIEGSTQLLQRLGSHYAEVLTAHQRLLRAACAAHGGYEVDTQGDSFFVAFPTAPDALAAAIDATRALAVHRWPEGVFVQVRMGLHSGAPQLVGARYVGLDVHRAARIASAGHGGQILLSEATAGLVRHDLPQGISLRDLGAHRLKDLQQAERIYQAVLPDLPADFPPLKALDARPHNLPVQSTALLGRERELETVCTLLRREDVRLVTLTGPGGIGKTRLGLQVAAELLDAFPDGVWNVRLSRLTDPELVIPTMAQVLDLKESGSTLLAQVVQGYLQDKHLLLLLDNFEQLVAAAPSLAALLEACPGVKALVTSRVPLHLHGEREYALRPLALPDPQHLPALEQLSQYAAVALFIERAQATQADFAVTNATAPAVAEICARLDGLPLAIELAAARVKVLPPLALLKRLERALPLLTGGPRELPERQQTMRATLAWSYDLLSLEEQRLFRRLAVFVGGCTLEAAEAVCAAPDGTEPLGLGMLDGLASLVDQSLLQQHEEGGEPRFGMLYVIREFALEQLEVSGEAEAVRRAHAGRHLALAEEAQLHVVGIEQVDWMERLEREHDNLRLALSWAHDRGQVELGLRLASALGYFWYSRGHFREGRAWLDGLLTLAQFSTRDTPPIAVQAKALLEAGTLAFWGGDFEAAGSLLERSAFLAQEVGNLTVAARSLDKLALLAIERHESERAVALSNESLALARKSGDVKQISTVLVNQGYIAYYLGDFDTAEARYKEGLAINREVGDQHGETIGVMALGATARGRGDLSAAMAHLRHALHLNRQVGDPRLFVEALEYLAMTWAEMGRGRDAARMLGLAAKLRESIGFPQPPVEAEETESAVADARAAIGEAAWAAAFAAGRALSLEEAIAEALGEEAPVGDVADAP